MDRTPNKMLFCLVLGNDSRNNCGTHFGFSSFLISKVAIIEEVRDIVKGKVRSIFYYLKLQ